MTTRSTLIYLGWVTSAILLFPKNVGWIDLTKFATSFRSDCPRIGCIKLKLVEYLPQFVAIHLYTNAIDYEKPRVHARLRSAAETWPAEFAPQAFLLLEASEVISSEVVTGLGTVEIRNRVQHTGIIRAEIEPPFLVLAVVGGRSGREGYLALRAYRKAKSA